MRLQTCLWLDGQAEQAAALYTTVFKRSEMGRIVPYGKAAAKAANQREGAVMTVELVLAGRRFLALNGGSHFKINPSISFFVGCESEAEMDGLWSKLAKTVRMDLKKYDFAPRYGWCADQFGVNWQLVLSRRPQQISPALLFANKKFGKAEEAIQFYTSQFPGSKVDRIARDEKTKAVVHSMITLAGQSFVLMEGPLEPAYDFSPAISFVVGCHSQAEIDDLWRKLSAVPQAEQCGWLQDKYGVSWQIVPEEWGKMVGDAEPAKRERLMGAILRMKKPDLAALQAAAAG